MIKSIKHKGLPLMQMYNPPHPGEFILAVYLEPNSISSRELAEKLAVTPSRLNRLLKGTSTLTPEMALRLSKTLGRSPESWLAMQNAYTLWQARKTINLDDVRVLDFA